MVTHTILTVAELRGQNVRI